MKSTNAGSRAGSGAVSSVSAIRATVTPGVYELYAPARGDWNRRTIAVWEVTISPARGGLGRRSRHAPGSKTSFGIECNYLRHEQYERVDRDAPWVYRGPTHLGISRLDAMQAKVSIADWIFASLSDAFETSMGKAGALGMRAQAVVVVPGARTGAASATGAAAAAGNGPLPSDVAWGLGSQDVDAADAADAADAVASTAGADGTTPMAAANTAATTAAATLGRGRGKRR